MVFITNKISSYFFYPFILHRVDLIDLPIIIPHRNYLLFSNNTVPRTGPNKSQSNIGSKSGINLTLSGHFSAAGAACVVLVKFTSAYLIYDNNNLSFFKLVKQRAEELLS